MSFTIAQQPGIAQGLTDLGIARSVQKTFSGDLQRITAALLAPSVRDADFHDHSAPSTALQADVAARASLENHLVGVRASIKQLIG